MSLPTALALQVHRLVQHAPDAIGRIDGAGMIVLANARSKRLFGHVHDKSQGRSLDAIVPAPHRRMHPASARSRSRERPHRSASDRTGRFSRRKDGTGYVAEVSAEARRTGKRAFTCVSVRDVTERNRVEARLRPTSDELERRVRRRTEQLQLADETLDSLSFSISHDLRTPLRHVTGCARLLQDRSTSDLDENSRATFASSPSRHTERVGSGRTSGVLPTARFDEAAGESQRPHIRIAVDESPPHTSEPSAQTADRVT